MSQLIFILTLLILIISGLGLYGLAAFTAEEKMKEISIRKALGASVFSLMKKFSWNFTKLVLIANIIAWPVSWYLLNNWLNNFASRIDLHWWIFIMATTFSVLFALITIATQAYITAKKNPVKVLNYE